MPINVKCPECMKVFRLPDNMAGKSTRCPTCKCAIPAPAARGANPFSFEGEKEKPGRRRNHDEDDDRDERPSRKSKSGSGGSAGLIIGLVIGGVVLLGGAGVGAWLIFGSDSPPKATVTINGQTVEVSEDDFKDLGKAFKDAENQSKDAGKAFADMGKGKAPKGKMPKDAGKMPSDADINKAFDKAFKDLGKGSKEAETDPRLTVKPEVTPLPDKTSGQVHLLRGRKDMFLVETSTFAGKEKRFTRFDLRNGKQLGTFTLELSDGTGGVEDVSPDGGLVAIRNFALGQNLTHMGVTIASVADGKFLTREYKPAYDRTNPDGKKVRVGTKGLRFLDSRRWLVVYEDNAVDVWTNSDSGWQRKQIRAGTLPPDKPPPFYAPPNDWGISNDGKTLAMWNGQGFDLIDTSTGAASGRTPTLEPLSGETKVVPFGALFSPDGSKILTRLTITAKGRQKFIPVCFPTAGSQSPVRVDSSTSLAEVIWWGDRHLLQLGNRNFKYQALVFDATTGKAVADFTQKGTLVAPSPDGKMRVLYNVFGDEKRFLVQCAFPDKLLEELQKPREKGKLPVVQANRSGVGILP